MYTHIYICAHIHTYRAWRREMTYFFLAYDFQPLPTPSVTIAIPDTEVQKSNANISDSLIIPNGYKDHDNRH